MTTSFSLTRLLRLFLTILLVPGCVSEIDGESDGASTVAITLSTTDAALILNLVNYPGTDEAVLDDAAGLDSRAAAGIVAHRAGADGISPSSDDDLFDDIAELDAIAYVGDVAFSKLQSYAQANPAPAAESVEGVFFRGWESETVTWGVNNVDHGVLDGMLDSRAAASLVAGRPFANVTQMGPMAYVGVGALERLRQEAPAWWTAMNAAPPETTPAPSLAGTFDGVTFDQATAEIALDIANRATRDQMVSNGVYGNGASVIVGNRPYTTLRAVSELSGVGTSTMQGLHAYATSGAWTVAPPPPVEPPPSGTFTPADNNCVFGLAYRDILDMGGVIIIARRVLDPASDTNAVQRSQIVGAVRAAYSHVTTVSEAFAAVDENRINHLELWDASNRVAYTAYEYGAGDNSYGLVFAYGSTTIAAHIRDGDLYNCTAQWGNEMRECWRTEDCAEGLTCNGTGADDPTGRCINLRAPNHPAEGTSCLGESGCPGGSGLVCAGVSSPWSSGSGYCADAWQRNYFDSRVSSLAIPDSTATAQGYVDLPLGVFGLATVATDMKIDLVISHARISDLRVTIRNNYGEEYVVIDAMYTPGTEISLRNHVLTRFPGDEYVNTTWTLRVYDRAIGNTGTIERFGLEVTSRWD
jgi:hypothetical protein